MEAKAIGKYLRVPPTKARLVLDTVRGKSANDALATLKFIPNQAARYIERILESAVANAVNNYSLDREVLRLSCAYVDQGPTLKRIQPRAMGRAYRIIKRTSHITLVVSEDEKLRKEVAPKVKAKGRKPARAKAVEAAAPKAAPKRAPKAQKAETKTETPATQGEATPEAAEE